MSGFGGGGVSSWSYSNARQSSWSVTSLPLYLLPPQLILQDFHPPFCFNLLPTILVFCFESYQTWRIRHDVSDMTVGQDHKKIYIDVAVRGRQIDVWIWQTWMKCTEGRENTGVGGGFESLEWSSPVSRHVGIKVPMVGAEQVGCRNGGVGVRFGGKQPLMTIREYPCALCMLLK